MNPHALAPPQPGGFVPAPAGQLEVHLSFLFLQWLLYFVSPRVALNGNVQLRAWGPNVFHMPPGQHQLDVFFPWLFQSRCGLASQVITIHPGYVTSVRYTAPFFTFMPGTLWVDQPRPMQAWGAPQDYPPHGGPQQLPPRS